MIVLKQEHRKKPFRLSLGDKVYCVGGGFTVKKTPPALPLSLSECTQEEYQYLYDNGFSYLFDVQQDEVVKENESVELETETAAETNTEIEADEPTKSKSRTKHRTDKSAT